MNKSDKIISPEFNYQDDEYPLRYLPKKEVERMKAILRSMIESTNFVHLEQNNEKMDK